MCILPTHIYKRVVVVATGRITRLKRQRTVSQSQRSPLLCSLTFADLAQPVLRVLYELVGTLNV